MIKLQAIGHLGKDCVVNAVNGKNVINFNVAHTEKFKDAAGVQKERTIWIECAYWTDRTAIAPYLKKGTHVYVEGFPDVRAYTTNDGRQGASLMLRIMSVQLLGTKADGQQQTTGNAATAYAESGNTQAVNEISEPADDLPF